MTKPSTLVLVCTLFTVLPAQAIVIDGGPAWPGNANTSGYSGSGNPLNGGDTWTYPNIGSSAVENLYFGLDTSGLNGFSGDGAVISGGEIFAWYADTGISIEYRGSISVPTTSGNNSYLTRLLLTAVSGGSVISDATTQALAGGVHSLIKITGASFSVAREIEILSGNTWQDALPFYDSIQNKTISSTGTYLNTGFYWDDPPRSPTVPEPATLGLIGLGLAGLRLTRRRARP